MALRCGRLLLAKENTRAAVGGLRGATIMWFLFRLVWFLALPIRAYVRWFPYDLAKDLAAASLLFPVLDLPDQSKTFVANVPGGARIVLRYREDLGKYTAAFGHFEREEVKGFLW